MAPQEAPIAVTIVTAEDTLTVTPTPTFTPTLTPSPTVDPMVNCNLEGIQAAVDEYIGEGLFVVTYATANAGFCQVSVTAVDHEISNDEWVGNAYETKLRDSVPGDQFEQWFVLGHSGNYQFRRNKYEPESSNLIGWTINTSPNEVFITDIELRRTPQPTTISTLIPAATLTPTVTPTP